MIYGEKNCVRGVIDSCNDGGCGDYDDDNDTLFAANSKIKSITVAISTVPTVQYSAYHSTTIHV